METGKTYWRPFASVVSLTAILAVGLLSIDAQVTTAAPGKGQAGAAQPAAPVQAPVKPGALSTEPVPVPTGGDIVDQAAAIRLGKAVFWDVQVGGDGQTACATCHTVGGADPRRFNTVNPGPDNTFNAALFGGIAGAGQLFNGANIIDAVVNGTSFLGDDRIGSQGLTGANFRGIHPDPTVAADICTGGLTAAPFFFNRRVTVRNAPTYIGTMFYRQTFLDGRGNQIFNGVNPFGQTGNQTATAGGVIPPTNVALTAVGNSPLASQAVGPVNSSPEMGCAPKNARAFNGGAINAAGFHTSIAAKMLARPVLQFQKVHPGDSALGAMSASPANGLTCGTAPNTHPCSYGELITAAFGPNINALTQFSRVWGQAVQAYEATLVPDRTPMDLVLRGIMKDFATPGQKRGFAVFQGGNPSCTTCHAGAALSDATVSHAARFGLINGDGGDQGFHNIGVRPTAEDLGRGAKGQGGVAFSESGSAVDMGAFKTPALRNVGLTAPYFHNGGKATLADVVDFYSRGGDFNNVEKSRFIVPRNFSAQDRAALVEFLRDGLTDCRVAAKEAPFDHPSITIPNGHVDPVTGLPLDLVIPETGGAPTCP